MYCVTMPRKIRPMAVWLFTLAVLAVIFQIIGIVSPAWMTFSYNSKDAGDVRIKETYSFGIFYTKLTRCIVDNATCKDINTGDDLNTDGGPPANICRSSDFLWPAKVFLTIGLIGGIVGFGLVALLIQNNMKGHTVGGFTSFIWVITGVFCTLAVAVQWWKNSDIDLHLKSKSLHIGFPWSFLMCGMASLFCFLSSIAVGIVACKSPKRVVAGAWNQFDNHGCQCESRRPSGISQPDAPTINSLRQTVEAAAKRKQSIEALHVSQRELSIAGSTPDLDSMRKQSIDALCNRDNSIGTPESVRKQSIEITTNTGSDNHWSSDSVVDMDEIDVSSA